MSTNRPELWRKFNSLRNRYGNNANFVAHMDDWPKTIRELVYGSERLMIHLGMLEPLPDHVDEEAFIGME